MVPGVLEIMLGLGTNVDVAGGKTYVLLPIEISWGTSICKGKKKVFVKIVSSKQKVASMASMILLNLFKCGDFGVIVIFKTLKKLVDIRHLFWFGFVMKQQLRSIYY